MTASITFYNNVREAIGKKLIDFDSDTFKVILMSSSYTPDAENHTQYSDITNELATANGYTNGGQTLNNATWVLSTVTVVFDADNTQWTANGGSIVARYAGIYDDTSTDKLLVAYYLLDTTPADVTAADENVLSLAWHSNGILDQT